MSDECALWYYCHGAICYELYDGEASAANGAFHLADSGQGAPVGVQLSDGTFVGIEDWTAYRDVYDRVIEAERSARPVAPRPTRTVKAPFGDGRLVEVDADAPAWLGREA